MSEWQKIEENYSFRCNINVPLGVLFHIAKHSYSHQQRGVHLQGPMTDAGEVPFKSIATDIGTLSVSVSVNTA